VSGVVHDRDDVTYRFQDPVTNETWLRGDWIDIQLLQIFAARGEHRSACRVSLHGGVLAARAHQHTVKPADLTVITDSIIHLPGWS